MRLLQSLLLDKSILYTASPPILYNGMEYELKTHGIVTVDERDQLSRLIVTFKSDDGAKVNIYIPSETNSVRIICIFDQLIKTFNRLKYKI